MDLWKQNPPSCPFEGLCPHVDKIDVKLDKMMDRQQEMLYIVIGSLISGIMGVITCLIV